MKNRKKKQTTFEKSLRQALILSCIFGFVVLIFLGLYKSTDTRIEKIFALALAFMFLFPLIPITFCFIINFITNGNKNSEMAYKGKLGISKPSSKANTEPNKYKLKIVTTEGYEEFRNELTACVKNKLLNRKAILKLKCELKYRIGTHIEVYKNFEFQNDLHEIYILSKSSVLTKDDYEYLTQFISNNLIFSKEA